MKIHRSLKLIALISLVPLPLGTIACSHGSSPTEPALSEEQAVVSTTTSGVVSVTEESKGKGKGRGRGGRGGGQDDNTPRAGREFEGSVASVGGSSLILANGTRVVVNGQTQWSAQGDLRNLNQVSRSVAANRPTRAEGRGNRQADGAILALTLKVEVDD